MDADRIVALLEPFMGGTPLAPELVLQLQVYLELLLRWNARINLTSVRNPDDIVTRHFGESLFAARLLHRYGAFTPPSATEPILADVGSGAGFPGIPIKLFAPQLRLTLIESQNKKATFLNEVIRLLRLENAEVFGDRAERWGRTADIVTMRAVERFQSILPVAADLVRPRGLLCMLVGATKNPALAQVGNAEKIWDVGELIPQSKNRYVLVGNIR